MGPSDAVLSFVLPDIAIIPGKPTPLFTHVQLSASSTPLRPPSIADNILSIL